MFLDWIAQLQLLRHDPQTNILGSLPLSTRRVLVSEITHYLHPGPGKHAPDPSIFTSPAHVKWYFEVIGQGFTLPLEDMDITSIDVNLYAQWLLEPSLRPAVISKDGLEQEFYQIIFHQYSLLFQPRLTQTPQQQQQQHQQQQQQQGHHHHHHHHPTSTPPRSVSSRPNSFHLGISGSSSSSQQPNHHQQNEATLAQLAHQHIELCKKTLTVLAMAGRTLEFSNDTWTVLLKVMLGVTDYLLKEPIGAGGMSGVPNMGDELCEHLLKVLFELWLRSEIRQVEMWDILKSCFMRWTHRPQAIRQWSSTSLALTKRVVNLLYGSEEGTDLVILSSHGTINVKLDLEHGFMNYAWHQMLHLSPHPLQLPSQNFAYAMLGIGQCVDVFNNVGYKGSDGNTLAPPHTHQHHRPEGNTILHIFGTYLFDACSAAASSTDPDSQRGCAEAYATLCKIFCRPQHTRPFLRTYIERFYAALCMGLKSEACLPTILLHCTELFATDLEGVRMLVPDFITAIKMVLPKLLIVVNTDFVSVEDLRLAAIKVVSTVMCLPNHFDKVELKPEWDRDLQCASDSASILGEQEQIVTQLIRVLYADQPHDDVERPFTCLKFYILEVLLMSLRTETSSYNMRYLLHLINVYVVEDVPFCPGLVGTVVKLIEEKILTMQMPADVTLVAFDVLIDFVDLYDYVKRDSKNVARELVLALSRYVDTLINAGKLSHSYPLIVQAYDCMMKWILTSQWIIDDRDCYKAVISTLSRGITIFDRDTDQPPETPQEKKKRRDPMPSKPLFQLPPRPSVKMSTSSSGNNSGGGNASQSSSRSNSSAVRKEQVAVRMAAEYCMSQFVNQLGRASPLNGSVNQKAEDLQQLRIRRSQRRSDQGDLLPWESRDAIRYFLLDKRMILAVFDIESQQDEKDVPAVKFIIRDTTGRHIWSIDAQYKDAQKHTPSSPLSPPPPQQQSPKMAHQKSIGGSTSVTDSLRVSEAPTADAANSDAIPSIDDLVSVDPASWSQWEFVKSMAECEQEEENETLDRIHKRPLDRFMISPTASNVNTESARGFRLLLSELGLLLPKNRSRITPLRITDSLITEIETLDMLNDRDCISITAYYASSGNTTWEDLIETPPPLSPQFLQFLNCLGWPIQVESHTGFKGKLDSSICKTIPYYADRNVEFVVNVPYFLHTPPNDDNTWGSASNITKIHRMVSADDHVCVIWIEDLDNYTALAKRIKTSNSSNAKSMVYIFINPLRNSANSLYWIRVHIPLIGNNATSVVSSQRLNDNALIFGPLADGMIVSRHALGSMVRNTAISAHQACRVVTDTYTRPYVVRKQFIEEMLHRHRSKMQLSEFYAEMFSGKDT